MNTETEQTNLIAALNWRYAAKNMTGAQVPDKQLDDILEAIRLSPSSAGLQPYKVAVISDHELKGKIHAQACPQPQVVECSHLLVFASQLAVSEDDIDALVALMAATRGIPVSSLAPFADSVKGGFLALIPEVQAGWAARQAYIALGVGLVAAAEAHVDATPMEGFNPDVLDELLGLKEKGLHAVVMLALGYRDEAKDFLAGTKKVRQPADSLFIR